MSARNPSDKPNREKQMYSFVGPLLGVENLDIARRTGGIGKTTWREEQVFALFPDLAGIRDRRSGVLSGGQRQVFILEKDEVRFTGTPADLVADEGIVHQFLTV